MVYWMRMVSDGRNENVCVKLASWSGFEMQWWAFVSSHCSRELVVFSNQPHIFDILVADGNKTLSQGWSLGRPQLLWVIPDIGNQISPSTFPLIVGIQILYRHHICHWGWHKPKIVDNTTDPHLVHSAHFVFLLWRAEFHLFYTLEEGKWTKGHTHEARFMRSHRIGANGQMVNSSR